MVPIARPGRKEHVLEAAVALFSQKGYHGTTVRDIALTSGMLSGSLYAHFAGKEELLFAIVEQAAMQFLTALEPIVEGPGTAAEKLRAALAAHLRVVAQSRDAATIFLHEWRALSPERREPVLAWRKRYEELLGAIIGEGVKSGEFRRIEEPFARLLVLSAANWAYQWYSPDGPLGPEAVADRFADLILQGLIQ